MRSSAPSGTLALLCGLSILSCSERPTAPFRSAPEHFARIVAASSTPALVISQIYGGGGNSGATYKNDFIEIFNPGGQPVDVTGWSVQYASAAGSTWQVTALSGTIQAGHYYLVQESQGTGGTTALPAPNATGTIAMSATAGKVLLAATTSALTGTCPTGIVDKVSFGSAATDCGSGVTTTLTNTTAAIRGEGGCTYTGTLSTDFTTAAPSPRNSASPTHICPGVLPVGPLDHVLIAGATTPLPPGGTTQLTATAQDVNNQTITTATISWSSSDPSIAFVDGSGKVTGIAVSPDPVTITAQAVDADITKEASVQISVQALAIHWIDVSFASTSFPPGFQTQFFATARVSQGGTVIPAIFTFEAIDPDIATVATVQNTAIVTGVAAPADGTTRPGFRVIATPVGGDTPPDTFVTHSIFIETPNPAPTSIYATNDEFGDPSPATAVNLDDRLVTRSQYTLSYNASRGTPNWVSYELDSRQMVPGQDRCNCFTADPLLPSEKQIFTSDYTNGGFDRGHMTRSADRTAGNVDNATTYFLTNVVPQFADLNQGVWAQFENAIADSANKGGRAVYVITGPLYSRSHALTFVKNEGKIAIPDSTWKIAIIGPRNAGVPFTRSNLQTWDDVAGVTVLAVNMPNVTGVRNDPWAKYLTTVDKVEEATGYDFLSLLPVAFQNAVEAGDRPPVAQFSVSGTLDEGAAISFDAAASTDPDLGRTDLGRTEALTYAWHFSDGTQASGQSVSKTFADNGAYTATLVVSDAFGWEKATSQTVTVANIVPSVSLSATTPVSILSGESVSATGSFTDPGSDAPWQAVLDWGNGTVTPSTLSAASASVTGTSTFFTIGTYTVALSVTDKDGAVGSRSFSVTVARRPVVGTATPTSISLAEPPTGDIKITLQSSAQVDISTLDPSSVSVGTVGLTQKKVKFKVDSQNASTIVLRFDAQALIDAGLITASTTELDVTGNVSSGVQIISRVPFTVH